MEMGILWKGKRNWWLIYKLVVMVQRRQTEEKHDTRKLNPEVKEFQPRRSERKANKTARNRVVGIALNELEEEGVNIFLVNY